MKFLKPSFKDIAGILAGAYPAVLFAIYPLYLNGGYVDIGTHKYYFFIYSSVGALILLCITGFPAFLKSISTKKVSVTDIFIILYMVESIISFAVSTNKSEALIGTNGWFMGLITILVIFMLYFLISRLWSFDILIIYLMLAVSATVYILGILDRFSLYLIPLKIRNASFISTIGNINWFMGYYSVITPVGIGLYAYMLTQKDAVMGTEMPKTSGMKLTLMSFYTVIAFMAGFAQGSESVILFDAALFIGLIILSLKDEINIKYIFLSLGIWGLSAQIIRIMRTLTNGYNYETTGLCAYLTSKNLTLIIGIIGLLLWYICMRIENKNFYKKLTRYFCLISLSAVPIAVILWLVLSLIRTNTTYLSGLNENIFLLNENFGSGRGEAFKAAVDAFKEAPFINKLFGIGPDCFSSFVYSIPRIKAYLTAYWENDRLTNAHCEMLTMLVNQGIFGVILYTGVFISFIREAFNKSQNAIKRAAGLSVLCCLIHNLISFATVLNLPFEVMLMAISVCACREIKGTED